MNKNYTRGNILFLILIAVALFAALSYAVTSTTRTGGSAIESEKAKISEGELNFYMAEIEQGRNRLTLINSCSDINYAAPADQSPTGSKNCHLFHPDGGGVIWRDLGLSECDISQLDISTLALGETGCGVIYTGTSGGRRLYVLPTNQGNNIAYSIDHVVTGATSSSDGLANTNLLLSLPGSYPAAETCRALGEKWYLPAVDEMLLIFQNRNIGDLVYDFSTFTTSTEVSATNYYRTSPTSQQVWPKQSGPTLRCVRRD